MANQFCQYCGAAMEPGSSFCQSCGKAQQAAPQQTYSAPAVNYAQPAPQAVPAPAYAPYPQPGRDEPLSVGSYILMFIITGIPVVGFIMLLVWAFSSDTNRNKKNFARATLILYLIVIVLWIIMAATLIPVITSLINDLANQYGSGMY